MCNSSSSDQNPRAVASQSGPEGPWPTGARWRVRPISYSAGSWRLAHNPHDPTAQLMIVRPDHFTQEKVDTTRPLFVACEVPCALCAGRPAAYAAQLKLRWVILAPSTVRSLARDPRVLIGWPLPLGFGLDGCLLLARRGRVYVQFIIITEGEGEAAKALEEERRQHIPFSCSRNLPFEVRVR